ncbi:MAG: hypothetical protein ACE5H8_14630 [Alphaproteobacteria bacterium]
MTRETGQIGELIDITGRLAAVMAEETALLRAMRTSEIEPLQEIKSTLAAAYAGALESLRRNPPLIRDAGPDLRETLKGATDDLIAKLGDNLSVVHAARTVNERLIRTLGDAVAEQRSPIHTYSSNGGKTQSDTDGGALSVTVDHRI